MKDSNSRSVVRTGARVVTPPGKRNSLAAAIALAIPLTVATAGAAVAGDLTNGETQAAAQSQPVYLFDIPARPLPQAITELSAMTGIQVLYTEQSTFGHTAPALQGSFTIRGALQRLLAGSGLVARFTGDNSVTIELASEDDGQFLETLLIKGASMAAATESTGSYTPRSSGSAAGLQLSLRETPQSVTVVTRQQIDDFSLETVDQVLANTPGISVNRAETDRAFPTARGFKVENISVDGVSSAAYGLMSADLLSDTAIYDRVEVVRGAAGLLSGSASPSASINLVRKRPTRDFQGQLVASAGRWDAGRLQGDLSGSLVASGSVRGRLVTAYDSRDSYIDYYSNDKTVAYGIVEADLSPGTVLGIGIDYQAQDVEGTTYGEPVPFFFDDGTPTNFGRNVTTSAPWSTKDNRRTVVFADLTHRFNSGWQVKLSASDLNGEVESDKLLYMSGHLNRQTGEGLSVSPNSFSSKRDLTSLSATADGQFGFLGRKHELLVGWSKSRETIARTWYEDPAVDVGNFFDWPAPDPGRYGEAESTGGWTTDQWGGFVNSRWSLVDDLTLLVGTRISSYEYTKRDEGVEGARYDHSGVSTPYAGLIYDVADDWSVYTSYTEVFKPTGNRDRDGNVLKPESGANYELGLKGEHFDGTVNSSFAVFRVEQSNVSEPDVRVGDEQRYKLVDGVTSRGFEAELNGEIYTGLNLAAGYTYRTSEDVDGNKVMRSEPRQMLRLSSNYRLPDNWRAITVGGAIRYQSETIAEGKGPNGENARQGAYAIMDLRFGYDFSESVSAGVNLNNVFDRKYYSSVPVYNHGYYGEPRNLTVSLRGRF